LPASIFSPTSARFPGTWEIFSSPLLSKLTSDGLGLQSNGYKQNERALGVELLGRNIAPLHFQTERVPRPPYAHRDFGQL